MLYNLSTRIYITKCNINGLHLLYLSQTYANTFSCCDTITYNKQLKIIRTILVNGKVPFYFKDQHKPFQNDKHFEIQTNFR